MELKTARLTLLIDPNKKVAFEHLCAHQDRTASQVVRQLIRDYLAEHGVDDLSAAVASVDSAGASKPSRAAARPNKSAGKKAVGKAAPPTIRSNARRR